MKQYAKHDDGTALLKSIEFIAGQLLNCSSMTTK